jgi:hypothetical protein
VGLAVTAALGHAECQESFIIKFCGPGRFSATRRSRD